MKLIALWWEIKYAGNTAWYWFHCATCESVTIGCPDHWYCGLCYTCWKAIEGKGLTVNEALGMRETWTSRMYSWAISKVS